jgi:hypothetical protein
LYNFGVENYINLKKQIIFILLLSLYACNENGNSDILSQEKMVGILIRLHIAEAKTSNSYLVSDTLKIYYKTLEDSIFKHYATDKATFEKSYKQYMQQPSTIEKIYTQVVDSLSLREAIKKVD